MDISGNTIFIPGATRGIGRELALALHAKGNEVIIGGRSHDALEEIASEHPTIGVVQIDTANPQSIITAAKYITSKYPNLNVIITMAGIMRIEDWRRPDSVLTSSEEIINTNVLGTIRLIAAFLEHLISQPAATVMTVTSGLAFVPLKATPTYNASKAAVHMLTESLRLQLAQTSVRLVELQPPAVQTDLVPGQKESDFAVPLDEYISEVMHLLETQPDANEIQVEWVKRLRYAEARGEYDHVVATLNERDPSAVNW